MSYRKQAKYFSIYAKYQLTIISEEGYQWEEGPNSFQPNNAIIRLTKELGMLDELVFADPSLLRFIYWNKQLHSLPTSLIDAMKSFNLISCKLNFELSIMVTEILLMFVQ